jgi:hypothetical protein
MLLVSTFDMLLDAHDSLSFLSSGCPADAGVAFNSSGELEAEGGEAGFSVSPDPNPASRLEIVSVRIVG